MLDWIWQVEESVYISVTAHSGTVSAILANVGHRAFNLQTGGMIPVVIKGVYEGQRQTSTKSLESATAPPCAANPSIIPTSL